MTNQKIKFYKFSNSTESASKITTAKAVEGAIIYIVDLKQVWIGGASPKLAVAGSTDVSFANNLLTVTSYNESTGAATTQTLDFSDVASAGETFKVFQNVYGLMGATASGTSQTLNYTGTHYLTNETNLVDADKALDTAIHTNTHKGAATGAVYDTQHLSQTWATTVTNNAIAAGETLDVDIDKLDKKIAGLADEVIANEQVTQEAFNTVANSVGLESDMTLNLTDDKYHYIKNDTSVKEALDDLDAALNTITTAAVTDVKINTTSIVDDNTQEAIIAVDGTYDASENKIATQTTVSNAIDAISGAGLEVSSSGAITATTQTAGDNTTNVATTAFVKNAIDALDGSATIATVSNNVVAIKAGVTEDNGVISNNSGSDIVLEEVAVTGAAADVSYANSNSGMAATNVQSAIDSLDTRIDALEGSFDVIKSTNAANTPYGVTWMDGSTQITGTLTASADTFHKVYLVPKLKDPGTPEDKNTYTEYITTRTNTGTVESPVYTYDWEKLGDIAVDLTGYAKSVTVNGKTYTVPSNSTDINVGDVITSIVGETAISGGDINYVKVAASTTQTTADGTNITTLSTTTKIEEVADGYTKDGTASYTDGHYVIENGKLVSAVGKSTGDTYTKSANDGLVVASDAKAYVDSSVDTLRQQVISNERVTQEAISAISDSVGLEDGFTLDLSSDTTGTFTTENNVKDALLTLATKVNSGFDALDISEYAQAAIDTSSSQTDTTITIKGIKETNGLIGTTGAQDTNIVAEGTYNASTNKLATQSTVTNAINTLNANPTSDDAAVARVQVVETNGVITDVVVSNINAGVSYKASTSSSQPSLTASTATGAVTGADIATIKSYIDDAAVNCWEEYV